MGEVIRIVMILIIIFAATGLPGIQTLLQGVWEIINALPSLLFPDGFDLLGFMLDHPYQLTGIIMSLLCGVFGIWLGRKGAKIVYGIVSFLGVVYSISSLCT